MTNDIEPILRLPKVIELTGRGKSAIYADVKREVFPKPVPIGKGKGCVGWPASEIAALNRARIAGKSEADIRALVARLHAKRVEAQA